MHQFDAGRSACLAPVGTLAVLRSVTYLLVIVLISLTGHSIVQTEQHKQGEIDKMVGKFNELVSDSGALLKNTTALCSMQKRDDFRMQEYCMAAQLDGYNKFSKIWRDARENIPTAAGDCVMRWSEDLLFDWRMIQRCIDNQLRAWRIGQQEN